MPRCWVRCFGVCTAGDGRELPGESDWLELGDGGGVDVSEICVDGVELGVDGVGC